MMKGVILKKLIVVDFNLSIFELPVNPSGILISFRCCMLSRVNFKIKILITAWYHIKFLHSTYYLKIFSRVIICKLEIVKSNPFKNIRSYNTRYADVILQFFAKQFIRYCYDTNKQQTRDATIRHTRDISLKDVII